MAQTGKLIDFLRAAKRGAIPPGWLYLADEKPTPETRCIIVDHDQSEETSDDPPDGFPYEGLDDQTISAVVKGVLQLARFPSDELLVRGFQYYVDFDAYLPAVNAPDPPPWPVIQARMDREFYDALGPERSNVACRHDGCTRGAVSLSVFCRPHHFASVKSRPSPFED
ncbi:MAG TPA: hypothetical protein VIO94_02235 [Phenylobacterium sp.]